MVANPQPNLLIFLKIKPVLRDLSLVKVKGQLKRNPDFNLQIPYMFAGVKSDCIIKRNLSFYNGIRLTLRSDTPLKLKLAV